MSSPVDPLRIHVLVCMTTCIHTIMKNFKRNGVSFYPAVTAAALSLYALSIPLAHMAHLMIVYTRAYNMHVVKLTINPKQIVYFFAAVVTMLFVGPGVYGVYSLSGIGLHSDSKSSMALAHLMLKWGTTAVFVIDVISLFTAFAMFATFSSYIEGRFRRTISLCLVLTSAAMLANTFWLTHRPTRLGSVQEFAEDILDTNSLLFGASLFTVLISRMADASDRLPEPKEHSKPHVAMTK